MTENKRTPEIEERIVELKKLIEDWTPVKERQVATSTRPGPEPLALTKVEDWQKELDRLERL